jgi:hypothetical protein
MKLRYTVNGSTQTLDNVKVTGFQVENIFDGEDFARSGRKHVLSGTALMITKAPTTPYTSSTGALDILRNHFNTPRGTIEVQLEDDPGSAWTALATSSDTAGASDARNGPLPSVSVSRIEGGHGNSALIVGFTFTYYSCGDNRIQRFAMSVTQSIDEAGFCTMTRQGTLVLSAVVPQSGASRTNPIPYGITNVFNEFPEPTVISSQSSPSSPDLYRYLVAGRPPEGFRRIKQDYTVDSSMRSLAFTVEDRLVFRALKYPVMMGDGSFSYEQGIDNIMGTKNFSVTFEGQPDTPPQQLLWVAVEAATNRIDFTNDIIQSITIREPNLYTRNKIELSVVAKGRGAGGTQAQQLSDPSLVKMMFGPLHDPNGSSDLIDSRFITCYPRNGVYLNDVTGFVGYDPCRSTNPSTPVEDILESGAEDDSSEVTLRVEVSSDGAEIKGDDQNPVTRPLTPDAGTRTDEGVIKHLESNQEFHTVDSGVRLVEATGGFAQWPVQVRMPVVSVTQTVSYVSNDRNTPIPYANIGEPFMVTSERIAVNNAPPDASGKPVFAVVATRTLQIQTSSSPNTYSGSSEAGIPRRIWSPQSVPQARGVYTANNAISNQQVTPAGNLTRGDYISNSALA